LLLLQHLYIDFSLSCITKLLRERLRQKTPIRFLSVLSIIIKLMSHKCEERGVFLYDDPTIERLKSCSFFWQNIIVFESYLSEVGENEELVEPTLVLLKEGILRILEDTSHELKSNLTDKIYCGLDKELWEYLYKHAEKISISPSLPENAEQIIQESTKRDSEDQNLKNLMDNTIYTGIWEKWMDALRQNERLPFERMPPEIKEGMIGEVKKITKIEYDHYLQRGSETRFGFEYRNQYLLEQMSVSSALYAPTALLPYYSYKLGDYSVKDARKYLNSLDAVMPIVKRQAIDNFSLDEILKIRRGKKWDEAMIRLSELCNEVKYGLDIKQFTEEMQSKVISECLDALDQKAVTWKDLGKDLAKGSVFTGISLIPIIGPVVSAAAGLVDPIVSYFRKEQKEKSLPIFLNDLRKLR